MPQTFSDYVTVKVPFLGSAISVRLRALDREEAKAFRSEARQLQEKHGQAVVRREGEDDATLLVRVQAALADADAFAFDVFTRTKKTKNGERGYYLRFDPLVNEDDDERSISTAEELYRRGGWTFRQAVIQELVSLIEDEPLGNSSGSPSTSTSAAGPTSTDEAAPTTEALETSPESSTATAPTSPDASSSQAA